MYIVQRVTGIVHVMEKCMQACNSNTNPNADHIFATDLSENNSGNQGLVVHRVSSKVH